MDSGGSNGGAVLKSSIGQLRQSSLVCIKQEQEGLEMWLDEEKCGLKVEPRLWTGKGCQMVPLLFYV